MLRGERFNEFIPQNVCISWFSRVNSLTKSSTFCLLLLIETLSRRFCGGVNFLEIIDRHIVPFPLSGTKAGGLRKMVQEVPEAVRIRRPDAVELQLSSCGAQIVET